MAEYITTLTALTQRIRPENDGILRDNCMTDGWLNGRDITISGSNFVVGVGYLVLGGRLCAMRSSSTTLPIPSGGNYAFLIATVNTNESLAQMTSLDVTVTSSRSFPTITQQRINTFGGGTTYQVILAAAEKSGGSWSIYFKKFFSHALAGSTTVGVPGFNGWNEITGGFELEQDYPGAEPDMNVIVTPAPADRARYIENGVYLYDVQPGKFIWRCTTRPGTTFNVNLLFL